jgi:hypothetical protein
LFFLPENTAGEIPTVRDFYEFSKRGKNVQIKERLKELSHTTSKRAGETAL